MTFAINFTHSKEDVDRNNAQCLKMRLGAIAVHCDSLEALILQHSTVELPGNGSAWNKIVRDLKGLRGFLMEELVRTDERLRSFPPPPPAPTVDDHEG